MGLVVPPKNENNKFTRVKRSPRVEAVHFFSLFFLENVATDDLVCKRQRIVDSRFSLTMGPGGSRAFATFSPTPAFSLGYILVYIPRAVVINDYRFYAL